MNAAPTADSGAAILENPAPETAEQVGRVSPCASSDPHSDYFANIYPTPPIICGRHLKVLSIGRYRLLKRFKVSFVADEPAEATAGDLLISVLICSLELDEFYQLVSSPNFSRQLDKWSRKFGFLPPLCFSWPIIGALLKKLFGRVINQADAAYLTGEIQKFKAYINDNSKSPPYWDESPESNLSGAHWSQSVEVVLRGQCNWSKDEIDNEPLNKAIYDFYVHMEKQGLIRLMTAAEIEEISTGPSPEETAALEQWAAARAAALNPEPSTS